MRNMYCTECPTGCLLTVAESGDTLVVAGNECPKGYDFAEAELANLTRVLTATVRTNFPDVPVIPVRTVEAIPKDLIFTAMREIDKVVVEREYECGDVIIEDIAETGVAVIITSPVLMQLGAELENKNDKIGRNGVGAGSDDYRFDSGGAGAGFGGVDAGSGAAGEAPLDELGEDHIGGFVGAAGEAVGIEDTEDDEDSQDSDTSTSKDYLTRRGRARIDK